MSIILGIVISFMDGIFSKTLFLEKSKKYDIDTQ